MRDNRFVRTELIGLDVEVLSEPFSGVSGKVVDETKNTFTKHVHHRIGRN